MARKIPFPMLPPLLCFSALIAISPTWGADAAAPGPVEVEADVEAEGTDSVEPGSELTPQTAGACCVAPPGGGTPTCQMTSERRCAMLGGSFRGRQVHCHDDPCTVQGACCRPAGVGYSCEITNAASCVGNSYYQGDGVTCANAQCPGPRVGSCCHPGTSCQITTQQLCESTGGTYRGNDTGCSPPCPDEPMGGCCDPTDTGFECLVTSPADCTNRGGAFFGFQTDCSSRPCPPVGGCCAGASQETCISVSRTECESQGGFYIGDNSVCVSSACPPRQGACCQQFFPSPYQCYNTLSTSCVQIHQTWIGDFFCQSNACDDLFLGACCLPPVIPGVPNCRQMYRSDCIAAGGGFVGPGTICGYAPYCG